MKNLFLLSIGEMPASEGAGTVAVAAVCALGALALMYGVLELMNYLYRKKQKDDNKSDENAENTVVTSETDLDNTGEKEE